MSKKTILILGDILALALLTIIGFASHGEGGISFLPRMATTFLPVLISWFLLAPWLGLFDEQMVIELKSFWRAPLTMLFAAPLASILRSAMLGSAAVPLFTLILGLTFGTGILMWRVVYFFAFRGRA